MAGQEEVTLELAVLSLQRAKFFELFSTEYDWWGVQPGTLFLLGIFSLLDVTLLGMQMTDLAEKLRLLDTQCQFLKSLHLMLRHGMVNYQ